MMKPIQKALISSLFVLVFAAGSQAIAQGTLPRDASQMTVPHTVDSAEHAKYRCERFNDSTLKAQGAAALSKKTSDKDALACAADLRFELASAGPGTLEAHIDALRALLSYIDHIHTLKIYELGQLDWPEYDVRLEHAAGLASKLVPAARAKWPTDPAITILCAAIDRSLAGPTDPEVTLAAVENLKRAVKQDPSALHGMGPLLIGRSYLDLPPIFGGGAAKAIPYLEQARDLSRGDPLALRSLAEAFDQLGRRSESLAALAALSNDAPADWDPQLLADEWRMGEGLSTRLQAPDLVRKFGAERAKLVKEHPNLLSRKIESVWGHGETDPMSGKADYDPPKP